MVRAMKDLVKKALKVVGLLLLSAGLAAASLYLSNTFSIKSAKAEETKKPESANERTGVVISEVMTNNKNFHPADNGKFSDWVELYNETDNEVSLLNYSLTDKKKDLYKWPFPNVTIKSHGYVVVFMTGDVYFDPGKDIMHCSFKLNSSGDSLYLVSPAHGIADEVVIPWLDADVSYAFMDGKWVRTNSPSPGFENTAAVPEAFRKASGKT
jgi:hypothetical protein